MIRAFGRLAAVLVVGLGVAASIRREDIRYGPGSARRTWRARFEPDSGRRNVQSGTRCCRLEPDRPERHRRRGEEVSRRGGRVHGHRPRGDLRRGRRHRGRLSAVRDHTNRTAEHVGGGRRRRRRAPRARGTFPDQQAGLDDLYFAYLNGIPDGEAKTNGILVGEEVGVGMLLLRANDGLDSIVPYVQRPPGPGVYEPTAPAPPLGTRMPRVLPLALENASQFRPHGPPALHSGNTRKTSTR